MLKLMFALLVLTAGTAFAQLPANLDCKCTAIGGDEYLCKCTVAKSATAEAAPTSPVPPPILPTL
jgi:hypothetical protein